MLRVVPLIALSVFATPPLPATLILWILSLTNGITVGWKTADFIAPLAISVVLFVLFFVYESTLKPTHALFQLQALKYPNFIILMFISLNPYLFWACTQSQYANYVSLSPASPA
jgi:hypothetical protein